MVYVWKVLGKGGSNITLQNEPKATILGHQSQIVCVAVSENHDFVVSGSRHACLMHTLSGHFLTNLKHPRCEYIKLIEITSAGKVGQPQFPSSSYGIG